MSVSLAEIEEMEISLPKKIWLYSKNDGRIEIELEGSTLDNYEFWERYQKKLSEINPKFLKGDIGSRPSSEVFYSSGEIKVYVCALIFVLLFIINIIYHGINPGKSLIETLIDMIKKLFAS